MDIDLLSKIVKEIILDNDAVTLPGIGSFVTEIVPSTFSDKGYTINPPYRRLYFSPREGQDRLLTELYAKSNNIEQETATTIVVSFLSELRKVLEEKKTVIFPGLGRLRATRENNFFFVADEDLDIYPEGFGLKPVSLKTHQETPEEVASAVAGLAGILNPEAPTAPAVVATEPIVVPEDQEDTSAEVEVPENILIPEPEPEQAPEPEPEPEPTPEAIQEPAIAPEQEPEPEREPEPEPEPELEPEPEPEPEPELVPAETPASRPEPKKKWGKTVAIWAGAIIGAAVLALLVFLLLAKVTPDFIDRLLYSAEELELLK